MILTRSFGVLLYWGGEIRYNGELHYEPRRCNAGFVLKYKIGYEHLLDKIYHYMGLKNSNFKLNIILRCPCSSSTFSEFPVMDDNTLQIIYSLNDSLEGYNTEFYIQTEKIV